MRQFLFILIIYAAFISLGLPDSLLGVAWPKMVGEFHVAYSAAGIISMTIAICTVIASLQTARITRVMGTGKLVLGSVLLTAIGLIGFAFTQNFFLLIVAALPLGLGAGAIDTSLNDYVAVNLKAHHMNWLHAFWGVGATLGPMIMGLVLNHHFSWRNGYLIIGGIQLLLVLILFLSLPLWKQNEQKEAKESNESTSLQSLLKQKGVLFALLSFLFYVGLEGTIFLWGSSYLFEVKSLSVATSSFILSIFFASLTLGRIFSGFITFWLSNQKMLLYSEIALLLGILIVAFGSGNVLYGGFLLIGLGCAAIFPTMIHETPRRFGERNSRSIIGFQVASGYVGIMVLPPLLGVLFENFSMNLFPIFLFVFAFLLLGATVVIDKGRRTTNLES
ncbi:MFS transporter [Mesobacillus maritimus]|uniref:MFS transporter n=1 Tax=Mesobacillus maritimus TaxID=1643336 RepID=UPI00203C8A4B|nr:MFS transporter [Mesobacillus maritimus]MCM3584754.1 MFS transporter [Mesobacillus maritimus]MCM3671880.1 MFS transporter [Mesobacillus maritimus]